MNVLEKLRSGHVRRWHIVAVSREQTIADHMYRVGVIAEEILRILGYFSWDNNLTLNVMRWAAIHDRHEYLMGDLPTPTKEAIREQLATTYGEDVFERAAADIDPEAEELRSCVAEDGECPLAGRIVKLADLLEAMNYIGIFGCGSHARSVWGGLLAKAADQIAAVAEADNLSADSVTGKERISALFALLHSLMEKQES